MKVYLAAPYPLRDSAIIVMKQLEQQGHEVTSTWLKQVDKEDDATARMDLADVDACEMLILWQPGYEEQGTGGRHVEFGYALARGKLLTVIGRRSNAFHQLYDCRVIDRVEDL